MNRKPQTDPEKFNFEHTDFSDEFLHDIVDYIGEFVVKRLKKKVLLLQCQQITHWNLALQEYDYIVYHRKRKQRFVVRTNTHKL